MRTILHEESFRVAAKRQAKRLFVSVSYVYSILGYTTPPRPDSDPYQ